MSHFIVCECPGVHMFEGHVCQLRNKIWSINFNLSRDFSYNNSTNIDGWRIQAKTENKIQNFLFVCNVQTCEKDYVKNVMVLECDLNLTL